MLDNENTKPFRFVMSAGKNVDKNVINDVAGRIERLISDARATYGKRLLRGVSSLLIAKYGAGWSADTLERCRTFYQMYSKSATVLRKSDTTYHFALSWSHYLQLTRIDSEAERSFYEIECQKQNWSVRQLQRQYNSSLYERLALSRDKDAVMRLAQADNPRMQH